MMLSEKVCDERVKKATRSQLARFCGCRVNGKARAAGAGDAEAVGAPNYAAPWSTSESSRENTKDVTRERARRYRGGRSGGMDKEAQGNLGEGIQKVFAALPLRYLVLESNSYALTCPYMRQGVAAMASADQAAESPRRQG